MEEYESLLDEAFKKVDKTVVCDRFEIRKAEGHHEGNKTIITNFMPIASCLRRKPEQFAKFLFKELAAPGEIAGERLILTRKVSSELVNEKIKKYVSRFVTCLNCKKPDTELVDEANKVYLRCLACGTKKEIHN